MPIPSTTASFANIQNELGGTIPISLSEYYNVSGKFGFGISGIPASGQISVNNFRGKSKNINVNITGSGFTIINANDNSNYNYAYFTNNSTFIIDNILNCDILIVGGGGGGGKSDLTDGNNGRYGGGGGGSGDVLYIQNYNLINGTYNINIGLGGSGGTGGNNSTNGGNTTITSNSSVIIGAGGGGGGADAQANSGKAGTIITSLWGISSGGGGGGGGNLGNGGSGNTYSGNGANGTITGDEGGGGGGGPVNNGNGINGGSGLTINIIGTNTLYGGGAGGQRNKSWVPGSAGGTDHGSGGGTSQNGNGGTGRNGVVIIRYKNNYNKNYPILKDSNGNNINPTAWYKFDDNTNIGLDSSGNGYHLTNNGSVSLDNTIFIKGTSSILLNGTNNLNRSYSGNLFSDQAGWSLSFWVYLRKPSGLVSLISTRLNDGSTLRGFNWYYNNEGTFSFQVGNDLTYAWYYPFNITGFYTDAINFKWYHFVLTMKSGEQKLYSNGILIGTDSISQIPNFQNGSSIFTIGSSSQNIYYVENGFRYDDVRYYGGGRILTQNQVTQLYNGVS